MTEESSLRCEIHSLTSPNIGPAAEFVCVVLCRTGPDVVTPFEATMCAGCYDLVNSHRHPDYVRAAAPLPHTIPPPGGGSGNAR